MGDISKALMRIGARELAGGGMTQGSRPPFEPKPVQGAKPPAIGRGRTPAASGGSGDVLVETSFASRTYWPDETVTSTDGAFTWIVKPIRRVSLQGGNWIDFADPTP
ncbi:hypothetical protein [Methyloversatilis sp. XJ19-49]|uniref:hypothetical protein n=1 Tax=Methyloversatilis sp. XJ19-49 TaxID=2963429 RepID=UPI00211CDCA9|nr:hypothetical protein [Methyloversatilis sp. XJ19-49]MCQ9378793.1 hypothetical protein [Methyloversatilis sp. XJ19-49]